MFDQIVRFVGASTYAGVLLGNTGEVVEVNERWCAEFAGDDAAPALGQKLGWADDSPAERVPGEIQLEEEGIEGYVVPFYDDVRREHFGALLMRPLGGRDLPSDRAFRDEVHAMLALWTKA